MEIARLLKEIDKKATTLEQEKINKERLIAEEFKNIFYKVKSYKEDVNTLCLLAQRCLDSTIDIGKTFANVLTGTVPQNYFYTDAIFHRVGFIVKSSTVVGFGLITTHECFDNTNLVFDTNGNVLRPVPNKEILEIFLTEIEPFKSRFTEYLMNLNA